MAQNRKAQERTQDALIEAEQLRNYVARMWADAESGHRPDAAAMAHVDLRLTRILTQLEDAVACLSAR